jgi:diacylglycerol kinase (ATP)
MVNTAAEFTIDLISDTYHPLARLVKDISAGAVLIASVNAIIIGYLVLAKYIRGRLEIGVESVRHFPLYVVFLALLSVLVISVLIKIRLHRGTPMKGGMPSVHSALAFAAATMVMLVAPHMLVVVLLAFFLALMVLQSRIAAGIHTYLEAALGALLGVLITLFLYRAFVALM